LSANRSVDVTASPFERFAKFEAIGGILLLVGTAASLVWSNSAWERVYYALLHARLAVGVGGLTVSESHHEWVNSGLMSIAFFLIGLEIKREVLVGELACLRRALFPILAALGGAIVPASIYFVINYGTAAQKGWSIPMATDVAVVLGVLKLLGGRIPLNLRIFVTSLAIVDDIVTVLEIAILHSGTIQLFRLAAALAGVALSLLANWLGIRKPAVYALIGGLVWFAVLYSGVHATVISVALAFTVPARTRLDKQQFLRCSRSILDHFETCLDPGEDASAIHTLEEHCRLAESPLERIEHYLAPWVSFLVLPVFAFANAGVRVLGTAGTAVMHPAGMGVIIGLLVGKPVGICAFAWLAAKTKLATPPEAVSWRQIFAMGSLCGIGFAMSLFIARLTFDGGPLLDTAKIGALAGSALAGICAILILITGGSPSPKTQSTITGAQEPVSKWG
jgi:NhaA family Na+:H+ antiporter